YNDRFGISVSVDGDSALVGAELDTTSPGLYTGSAYVFVRSGTMWFQQAKLTAVDGASNDSFGRSVCLHGDTALVGAYYDSTAAGSAAGSAYVFTRSGISWSQQAKLNPTDAAAGDWFGYSIALSGDTALVGAYFADTASGSNAGSAYVFVRSGTTWSEQAKLTAGDGAADDYFGRSVALSGDTALVGAYYDDTAGGADAGSAYIFVRSGISWSEQTKLTAADGAANDYFGSSVALSANTALVGSYYDDTASGANAGSSYVYLRTGNDWTQEAKLTAADGAFNDYFGNSVALSGDTALIGAYADDGFDSIGHSVADQGGVYVFRLGDSSAPEISIEQSGVNIANVGSKPFGSLAVGSTTELIFTILNTGNADLTLSGSPKVDLTGSPDFTVTAQPTSPVTGPAGSSNFTVRFTPTGSGLKTAALSIPNNDSDKNPFVINLTGSATTASALFTSTIAANSSLTGDDALPSAIPFNDGVENLLKYAFNMNLSGPDARSLVPGSGTAGLPSLGLTGSGASTMMRVEFLRRKGSGLVYTPKRSSTLAPGSFVPMSGSPVVTSIDANWERVVVEESANPATLPQSFAIVEVTLSQ
ncbi:MAG: choice-of-anchor D domain-containing protein, partial [Akkermansiaceae bacterium]|nr:choice-of-anchor D domain-containing protein [Akkermansiaceae bacterium]